MTSEPRTLLELYVEMKDVQAELNRRKAELNTLREIVKAQMLVEGKKDFFRNGTKVFNLINTSRSSTDLDALKAAHPRIVASYEKAKAKFTKSTPRVDLRVDYAA